MNLTERKEKIRKWATVGLIGVTGLVVSPVIFLAIQGLVGLVIAAIAGLTIVTFAPWVTMKFANWRVKAITAEAGENPIETMVNLLAAKREAFDRFRTEVETAVVAKKEFTVKCSQFAKQYPHRAEEFTKQLAAMSDLVERKIRALQDAKDTLAEGENKLTEMRAYWDMSQAAQAANKAAGMDTGDIFEKLKADTAVDAVFESMNKAFAQLEVAAALDNNSEKLEYSPATPLIVDIEAKKKVVV